MSKDMFEDLEALSRVDDRFDLLPVLTRKTIDPGEYAQLVYRDNRGAEHLWIEVVQRNDDAYSGRLDSTPALLALAEGAVVQFGAEHVLDVYRRQAVGQDPVYEDALADAQKLDAQKYWAPVLRIEDGEIANLLPASMRGADGAARLADYLARHPLCASCEARGITVEATTAVQTEPGDGDETLMALCRNSAYVLVARQQGWPVRGAGIDGTPNDPTHPWNA